MKTDLTQEADLDKLKFEQYKQSMQTKQSSKMGFCKDGPKCKLKLCKLDHSSQSEYEQDCWFGADCPLKDTTCTMLHP